MEKVNYEPNDDFIERFIALWNEPDDEARRRAVAALFAPHGSNYAATLEATGHDEIDARVKRSFDKWVRDGGHCFRRADTAVQAHHGAVRVGWEMVKVESGEVVSVGAEFLLLDDDGRIVSDHQFVTV
jgi:hypothetical protein